MYNDECRRVGTRKLKARLFQLILVGFALALPTLRLLQLISRGGFRCRFIHLTFAIFFRFLKRIE